MILKKTILVLLLYVFSSASLAEEKNYTAQDFQHFLDVAIIAQATYQGEHELETLLTRQGYEIEVYEHAKGFSVGYVLATNPSSKKHLIAVRGTANVKNAVVDAAFILVEDKISGIDLHQGFLLSARDIYEDLQSRIKPGYHIDTVGHSLGGAAAIILAMMFDKQGYPVDEVITFGQPKVTNITGSRKFADLNVTRLVTPKDIVPLVPPVDPSDMLNFSIFWHQGTEILLAEDNRYSVLSGVDSMMRASGFLNDVPSDQHITDHFMTSYIKSIQNKLINPLRVVYKSDFKLSDWFSSGDSQSRQ